MQLTSTQVQRTLSQFDAEAIPANHPALPQLTRLFGKHTFFLDREGLSIVEPAEPVAGTDVQAGMVVNVASWNNSDPPALEPHDPAPTDVVILFEAKH